MPVIQATAKLMVEDVNRAVAYYCDLLGFAFAGGLTEASRQPAAGWPAGERLAFAEVRSGQARLCFQSRASLAAELPRLAEAKIGGTVVVTLSCDDFDALAERLGDTVPFIKAPHRPLHGCRECSIEDINGYVLTLCESPANS
ncbi:MAG: VOC family protein [Solidesulfovibrio sp. DCME]|uniref:VOC family protein n=1 Tax=Solidesulfovibrio sp. DCME TaxID=3447380 RepID=UPI003D0D3053